MLEEITQHPIQAAKGALVTGGTIAVPTIDPVAYGDFLATHGVWALSYTEWIQIVGFLYVLKLLGFFKLIAWGYRKFKEWRK